MQRITWITLGCGLLAAALGGWLVLRPDSVRATPVPQSLQVAEAAVIESMDGGVPSSPTTATIAFITVPNVTATVTWGRKPLGKILPGKPLVVVRPRDSGPLDVMVRANGYLPVQTRAHTFSDSRVLVKLTPPDKKNELLGYRLPIDGGLDGAVEGGWPEGGFTYEGGALPVFPPAPAPPVPVPGPVPPVPVPEPVPIY